jgi:hypothetical protein
MGPIRPGVGDLLNTARCLDTGEIHHRRAAGQITKANTLIVELIRISEDTRQPWMDWGSVESSNECWLCACRLAGLGGGPQVLGEPLLNNARTR